MVRLILSGCNGHMGKAVTAIAGADSDVEIAAGIDINAEHTAGYPVYTTPAGLQRSFELGTCAADVIIDFSSTHTLEGLIKLSEACSLPLVLCTTGYSTEQIEAIEATSQKIAVFRSGNMSVGINLLADLIKRACKVLGEDFDVEIVERHHRRKLDAPSGTALMLADAASGALPGKPKYIFERESIRAPRSNCEIGISSVRGGTIVGVHDVIFAGPDEVIELRHSAASRDVFAAGAVRAAKFIKNKPPGMYDMSHVLK